MTLTLGLLVLLVALGASAVVAVAMLVLVLWHGWRKPDNQAVAGYLVAIVLWAVGSTGTRMAVLLGADPMPYLYVSVFGLDLSCVALFVFVTYYARLWDWWWVRVLAMLGAVRTAAFTVALAEGRYILGITYTATGAAEPQLGRWAPLSIVTGLAFYCIAIGTLWWSRRTRAGSLLWAGTILAAGVLTSFGWLLVMGVLVPLLIPAMALSSVLFTHAILRGNVPEPVAQPADGGLVTGKPRSGRSAR